MRRIPPPIICSEATKSVGMEIKSLGNLMIRLMEKKLHSEKIYSAAGTDGWVLLYLGNSSERDIFQRDLEKKFGISRSTASRVLTQLESKGLILRESVSGDGRLKKIILTARAREILQLMHEDALAAEQVLTCGFDKKELELFYSMTEKMKNNIRSRLQTTADGAEQTEETV